MRKVLLKLSCLAFMLGMLIPFTGNASHNVGGEITYTYTGVPNTYVVTYKFYRDCGGIPAPSQISLCYSSDSCGISGTIDLFPIPGTGQEIPPSVCIPPPAGGTTCNGGTGYGVQEHIFEATLVLPTTCHDWKFSYQECCRNGLITTLQPNGLYLDAYLNNIDFPTNSSPYFTTIPVTQFCVNNQFYFDQGAFDVDNDSLVYVLINAQDGTFGCPYQPFDATYNFDNSTGMMWSGLNPVTTATGTTIDPLTGVISFLPTQVQVAVIAVRCIEYDRATQRIKSTIKREIQINIVTNCVIAPPAFDSTFQANGVNIVIDGINNVACDDTVFYLTMDPPIQCGSIVPSDIRFRDPNGVNNPVSNAVGVNCVNGLTDSVMVTLVNPIPLGTSYIITKIGNDGNTFLSECGSPMDELDTLYITLTDSSVYNFAVNDTVDCAFTQLVLNSNQQITCSEVAPDGSDFILIDANGDTIPIIGAVCNGLLPGGLFNSEFTLTTASTTGAVGPLTLLVQQGSDLNTFSNACKNFILQSDTIGIIQLRNNIQVNLGSDITVCSSDPAPQLSAGQFPSYVSYSWTLNNNPTATDTANITATTSGTYVVLASASASCQGGDTIDVSILPSPSVALGSDITLCSGATFPQLNAGNAGASFQWYLNNTAISGATDSTFTPTAAGSYSVEVNVGANCLGRDTIDITVVAQLDVTVTDQTVCAGNVATLQSSSPNSGVAYQWTLNGTVIPNETGTSINVTQAGNYGVFISLNSGGASCSDSAFANVNVIEQPSATLSDITGCDNFPTLNPGYTGNTQTQFAWTLDGSSTGGNTATLPTSANGNYGVTITNSLNGVNCTATASMNLNIGTTPTIIDLTDDVTLCQDQSSSATLTVSSSGTTDTYQWSVGGNAISGATSNTYVATASGNYKVEVIGTGNCSTFGNVNVTIGQNPDPIIRDTVENTTDSVLFCAGQNVPLLGLVDAQNGFTYNWTLQGSNVSNEAVYTVNAVGLYSVLVTTPQGCTGTDEIMVVPGICDVTPPNVITPGTGTENEFFVIPGLLSYSKRKLTVYNRWGNEVYKAEKYNNDWNGGDLSGGTYFYVLELFNDITSSTKNGYIQIIK